MGDHDTASASATALGGWIQNLVQSSSGSMSDGDEGGSKPGVVDFLRRIPKKAWILMGLGVAGMAGMIFVQYEGGRSVYPHVGELIVKGRKRLSKRLGKKGHPSICTFVTLRPEAFNLDDPSKKRKFCAQDIFDVQGKVTCFGNPDWEKKHEKACKTAPILEKLTQCGATCIGKTVMDDMGFSLIGTNPWLGTPINPFSDSRICGGASSGAAVVVGSNVVDFAIGIDTVGDVRVPAACCGVLGFRSSHGAVSLEGTIPVASSCDALGHTLHNLNFLEYLEHYVGAISTFRKELDRMGIEASQYTALDVLRNSMLLFQRHEFKGNHGEWIAEAKPHFPKTVERQVERAVFAPNSEALRFIAIQVREEMSKAMNTLLKNDAVLVVPTLPSVPPKLAAAPDEVELFEYRTHSLMSIATLSGCCQVVIPVGIDGVPMSVSLLARKGADLFLLETVVLLLTTIQQEVLVITNPNLPITDFLEIR